MNDEWKIQGVFRMNCAESPLSHTRNPPHGTGHAVIRLVGKIALQFFSPGGKNGLSIFIYHRVLPSKDTLFPAEVDQNDFDLDLHRIGSFFNVLPLREAISLRAKGALPPRAACITFDDGYADNAAIALPILQRHKMNATFFIATGFINGGIMWNDAVIETIRRYPHGVLDLTSLDLGSHALDSIASRRQAISELIAKLKYLPLSKRVTRVQEITAITGIQLPTDLMMTDDQIKQLHRAGMGIGGHTVNHPILASLNINEARTEIKNGKSTLESIINSPVHLFAYPNGKPGSDYLREHVELVRELGFEGAVSTAWGANRGAEDLHQLPRFSPWDRTAIRFIARMARNLMAPADNV